MPEAKKRKPYFRQSLSCIQCKRKKTKCDRRIPCRNCTSRGLGEHCCRERRAAGAPDRDAAPEASLGHEATMQTSVDGDGATEPHSADRVGLAERTAALMLSEMEEMLKVVKVFESKISGAKDLVDIIQKNATGFRKEHGRPGAETRLHGAISLRPMPSGAKDGADRAICIDASTIEHLALGRAGLQSTGQEEDKTYFALDSSARGLRHGNFEAEKQLIAYFVDEVLWISPAVHGPSFLAQCHHYWEFGSLISASWPPLYYAALAAAVCYLPDLEPQDRKTKCAEYFNKAFESLDSSEWMKYHSLHAIQAICVLNVSAHILGESAVLQPLWAAAISVAQNLRIHLLPALHSGGSERELIEYQVKCRLWWILIVQDWFSIDSKCAYIINPLHFTTPMPMEIRADDRDPHLFKPSKTFTQTETIVASFMAKLAEAYREIYDSRLSLTFEHVYETCMHIKALADVAISELTLSFYGRPEILNWRMRAIKINAAHKLLSICRSFVENKLCTTESQASVCQDMCSDAINTILMQYERGMLYRHHQLWTFQKHAISAASTLIISLILKPNSFGSSPHLRGLERGRVENLTNMLGASKEESAVAMRGFEILQALLEYEAEGFAKSQYSVEAPTPNALTPALGDVDFSELFGDAGLGNDDIAFIL